MATKSAPGAGESGRGVGAVVDVEGDARDLEYLAPPGDQLEPARRRRCRDPRRAAGCRRRCNRRRPRRGSWRRGASGRRRRRRCSACRASRAPRVSRNDVLAPRHVHAVGAQRARQLRIALDECGNVLVLRQLDERRAPPQPSAEPHSPAVISNVAASAASSSPATCLRIGIRGGHDIQSRLNFMPHRHVTSALVRELSLLGPIGAEKRRVCVRRAAGPQPQQHFPYSLGPELQREQGQFNEPLSDRCRRFRSPL